MSHDIEDALRAILVEGDVYELRAMDIPRGGWSVKLESGYFNDLSLMAKAAAELSSMGARAVYYTPNPVQPDLLARCANRTAATKKGQATADEHVLRRNWLLIDIDPVRPSGISATDAEHDAAIRLARTVYDALLAEGWPEPIVGDSGNGAHLMYRVDEPNNAETTELFSRVLKQLGERFGVEGLSFDHTVFNASRIWKCPGTMARKGDNLPERPWRQSSLLYVPQELVSVQRAKLEQLAPPPPVAQPRLSQAQTFRLDDFILQHFPGAEGDAYAGGRKWVLDVCPFNAAHDDRSAVIIERSDGAIGFRCHHNGCTGRDWKQLREMLDLEYRAAESIQITQEDIDALLQSSPQEEPESSSAYRLYHPKRPDKLARDVVRNLGGKLIFWRGNWHVWTGTHWHCDDAAESAKNAAFDATCKAEMAGKDDQPVPYPTTRTARGDLVDAMERVASVVATPGRWTTPKPGWKHSDTVSTPGGLFNLDSHELIPHDRTFMATSAWSITPRPEPTPEWLKFLASTGLDETEVMGLQEQMGLLLSNDTQWGKIVLWIGLERSGKGTCAWTLLKIVGEDAWGATSPKSLGEMFGLQSLVDKTIAYVGDVRDWRSIDAKSMTERILTISGEDYVPVRRMHAPAVSEKLRCRFLITTNETPRFDDPSGVIASRHLITKFRISHLGREDWTLKDRLESELPGIAWWAMQGLARLRANKRFTESEEALYVKKAIVQAAAPISGWVDECLELRPDLRCGRSSLYKSYCDWTMAQGHGKASMRSVLQYLRDRHGCRDARSHGNERCMTGISVRGIGDPDMPF